MEIIYRAASKFGSKPVEQKIKVLSLKISFNLEIFTTHQTETPNSNWINLALKITQNNLT